MKFNHVTVVVADFERSKRFYAALGLKQIVDSPPRYARFVAAEDGATFSIEAGAETGGAGAAHIYFECADLDARFDALAADGFVFDHPPTDMPWLWREARLRDPDGRVVVLYWAGENRLNPPWRLTD
ncbi:MAG: VOC family protein [Parvularculaceae bacterium]|nr:VOC family protein [Parvularculaceae bacterium]